MTEPTKEGIYLVKLESGEILPMRWCGCWNCILDPITGEKYQYNRRDDIVEWTEIEEE